MLRSARPTLRAALAAACLWLAPRPTAAAPPPEPPPPDTGAVRAAPPPGTRPAVRPPGPVVVPLAAPATDRIFPWAAVPHSARHEFPAWLLRPSRFHPADLAEVDAGLSRALLEAGYLDKTYLAVAGGFALVTRLEHTRDDGTPLPGPQRWAGGAEPVPGFDPGRYSRALDDADPGRYRVLALVVARRTAANPWAWMTDTELTPWRQDPGNRLPAALARSRVTGDHRVWVLVFEFEKATPHEPARLRVPGRLTALEHLEAASLLGYLTR